MSGQARRLAVAVMCCAAVLAAPNGVAARQWSAEAQAGRFRSGFGTVGDTASQLALGMRYDGASTALRLNAGVPASAAQALWGGASLWQRLAVRRHGVVIGFDVAGQAVLFRERTDSLREIPDLLGPRFERVPPASGHAFVGQVLPVVGYEGARARAHVRSGLAQYRVRRGDADAVRTARVAELQLLILPTAALAVLPVARVVHAADENAARYAGVSSVVSAGRFGLSGSIGRWLDRDAEEAIAWLARATVRLDDRTTFSATARRDAFDPLTLQAPQTSWSLGFGVRLGALPARLAPPLPFAYENGRATIRLAATQSGTEPRIAGDFTGWTPQPMTRDGAYWTFAAELSPGVYHYAFVAENGEWFVPADTPGRTEDGMGGHVAVLVVPR